MTTPTLPETVYLGILQDRARQSAMNLLAALGIALLFFVVAVPGRIVKLHFARKRAKGDTIWLDAWTFGKKDTPAHNPPPHQAANLTANTDVPSRVARVMKREQYPEPEYPFAYQNPPISGNIINGLGEPDYRRASKVFHTVDYSSAWGGLEFYFHLADPIKTFAQSMQSMWENRTADGPVHPHRQPIADPHAMSEIIKAAALAQGASVVGITELKDHHLFEGKTLPYHYAISIAVTMDREAMLTVPSQPALDAIMNGYLDVGRIALDLAGRIRGMGWEAKAAATMSASEILHIPIAIDAGLGQLGKHGSLITKDFGSNVRLSAVLTNLPLAIDEPEDIGVDDFCASCQLCVTNCPPHAIFDIKQTVRGEERWYVNFDKCAPYFSEHGGCGICIEVCPWSEAGRGPIISKKMLERRTTNPLEATQ